jgi:hypothetical protein
MAHQLGGRQAVRAVSYTGFWGAIIVGLLSWLLSTTLGDKRHDREQLATPCDLRTYRTLSRAALARAVW